mgnify:CR=1 FL=1
MKHALLILFAAICFSSCTVENHYIQYDKPKEAREIRVVREPQRTTTVSYHVNTTPVIRTYHYTPPVVYRSYTRTTNYTPVNRTYCAPAVRTYTPVYRMRAGSNQYEVVGKTYTTRVRRHSHF